MQGPELWDDVAVVLSKHAKSFHNKGTNPFPMKAVSVQVGILTNSGCVLVKRDLHLHIMAGCSTHLSLLPPGRVATETLNAASMAC